MRRALSNLIGWASDLRIPRRLRGPVYRAYCRAYDVDLSEVRLALEEHPSFGAFFVRRLSDGARTFPTDPRSLPSPCDGTIQSIDTIREGSVLQAKGRPYPVRELLAGVGEDVELEGGSAWTIYLSPRDYHRVHSPVEGTLVEAVWAAGERYSVAPKVLAGRAKVLSVNERCVMRIETAGGPTPAAGGPTPAAGGRTPAAGGPTLFLVMVGALNVGRIRVVGVDCGGKLPQPRSLARGDELARFEMGSTVVLVAPPGGPRPLAQLAPERKVRMGEEIGRA